MDSRNQNDSDGGGGGLGWSASSTGSLSTVHDEGRPQPRPSQIADGPPDPGLSSEHAPPVLSLDQIRITGSSNKYTEGPSLQWSPGVQRQKSDLVTSAGSRTSGQQEINLHDLNSSDQHRYTYTSSSSREVGLWSSSTEDSQSSIRTSVGSALSGQRLLVSSASGDQIVRAQPKRSELNSEELKLLNDECGAVVGVPGSSTSSKKDKHASKCENCGRCKCQECSRPRMLPSCWTCGRRCVCSAENVVEYGTCVCCIKALFYHCSSDDEDTCADKPFSCSQTQCCVRWSIVSVIAVFFPCLLCYFPGKGCVAMCQSCYDRVARPGCRCRNPNRIHYEDEFLSSRPPPRPETSAVDI